MFQAISDFLVSLPHELYLILISMFPFIELRGAIPVGIGFGLNPVEVFIICVIANCIPIPFIIFLIKPLFRWLKRFSLFEKIITKLEHLADSKSGKITAYKYEMVGLLLFVGIPLPGTGAWSGALIAALLNMRIKHAFTAIVLGVILAGVLVTLISAGALGALSFFLG